MNFEKFLAYAKLKGWYDQRILNEVDGSVRYIFYKGRVGAYIHVYENNTIKINGRGGTGRNLTGLSFDELFELFESE